MIARIFGPPPLLGDEDAELYAALFSSYAEEYNPETIDHWCLVKDKTDLRWERLRERRLKPEVIRIHLEQADQELNEAEERDRPIQFVVSLDDARL